jgi:hypothetical protein
MPRMGFSCVSLCLLGLSASALLLVVGCGESSTGSAVKTAESHGKRTRDMDDYMKSQAAQEKGQRR